MKTTLHTADSRGAADFGWLKSRHTFSFGRYFHPDRVQFGALRVLNDDRIAGGSGFGTHPHDNMEIVSIPLAGAIEHKDSTGHQEVIRPGEVQIMSAGTGLTHSEYNHFKDQETHFLQIWIFPKVRDISPRYEQKMFDKEARKNQWQAVVSPEHEGAIRINQDAVFYLSDLDQNRTLNFEPHFKGHGVYAFLIEGEIEIAGVTLRNRDGLGIENFDNLEVKALSNSTLLLIEVPTN